jgi:hypothetical protein
LIVPGAVGDWGVAKQQSVGRMDCRRRSGIALTRQDVDDDVGGMNALGERLNARSHRRNHLQRAPLSSTMVECWLTAADAKPPSRNQRQPL